MSEFLLSPTWCKTDVNDSVHWDWDGVDIYIVRNVIYLTCANKNISMHTLTDKLHAFIQLARNKESQFISELKKINFEKSTFM